MRQDLTFCVRCQVRSIFIITRYRNSYVTWRYEVRLGDDRSGSFWVEAAYHHRIIRWRMLPDVEAELLATERLPYWQLSAPGDENALQRLQLAPGVAVLNVTKR